MWTANDVENHHLVTHHALMFANGVIAVKSNKHSRVLTSPRQSKPKTRRGSDIAWQRQRLNEVYHAQACAWRQSSLVRFDEEEQNGCQTIDLKCHDTRRLVQIGERSSICQRVTRPANYRSSPYQRRTSFDVVTTWLTRCAKVFHSLECACWRSSRYDNKRLWRLRKSSPKLMDTPCSACRMNHVVLYSFV